MTNVIMSLRLNVNAQEVSKQGKASNVNKVSDFFFTKLRGCWPCLQVSALLPRNISAHQKLALYLRGLFDTPAIIFIGTPSDRSVQSSVPNYSPQEAETETSLVAT